VSGLTGADDVRQAAAVSRGVPTDLFRPHSCIVDRLDTLLPIIAIIAV
jgi:hypothetical protein